jgi:microsomal dipeptidase-like Zn-dependent dipeptidase
VDGEEEALSLQPSAFRLRTRFARLSFCAPRNVPFSGRFALIDMKGNAVSMALVRALVVACLVTGGLLAQPSAPVVFDFEKGVADWTADGDVPQQTYCGPYTADLFSPSKLGGDYWKGLAYPLGQQGNCVWTTFFKKSGAVGGDLISPPFPIDQNRAFLSFRVSGSRDIEHERVELQILAPPSQDSDLIPRAHDWWQQFPSLKMPNGAVLRDGDYLTVGAASGHQSEMLYQVAAEIPQFLRGRQARFKIVDGAAPGHITVDYLRITSDPPPPMHEPVWGFGDYHTHPMSYMAFGGLKGIRTLWGEPGGNVDDYVDPVKITDDIPHCTWGHYGGYFAEDFIKGSQLEHHDTGSVILSILAPHKRSGGPEFKNFPDHLTGAHEQMHITGIFRAWQGGLRLIVALAVDNAAAQFLTGKVKNGHMELVSERESMEKQLKGMKQLAEANANWMKIAHSPEEAREIIRDNKLAVILGVEYDKLGELGLGPEDQEAHLEADYLWGLGARTVISIHAVNNKLGGPAILNEPYNWLNDLLDRRSTDDHSCYTSGTIPQYFHIEEDTATCKPEMKRGECVLHRLDPNAEWRLSLGHSFFNLFRLGPVIFPVPKVKEYDTTYGHKNTVGLKGRGRDYIQAMMDRGLLIDMAHMGDRSIDDTFEEIRKRAGTVDWYPANISHAHMRAQGLYEPVKRIDRNTIEDYLPSEYDISDSHLRMLSESGGVIGPFVEEPRIDYDFKHHNYRGGVNLPFPPNCGGSSINFAYSFAYAASMVNTPEDAHDHASRVGLATDMSFIPMVSPRFGDNACDGYKPYRNGVRHRNTHSENYQPRQQNEATKVRYLDQPNPPCAPGQQPCPLQPYRIGQRVYDFNTDGLANYGLLPDMLQDIYDLGDRDIGTLFQSAEGYLKMWERAERLRGTACCRN